MLGGGNVAEETKVEGKKNSFLLQIVVPAAITLLVGSSAPWWLHRPAPKPDPAPAPQPQPAVQDIEASREFFIGHWQVNQEISSENGMVTGTVTTNYYENGRFEGYELDVVGNQGQKVPQSGNWQVEILSRQNFRLSLRYDNGFSWTGTFRIVDRNHIHNIDANYDAVRVE